MINSTLEHSHPSLERYRELVKAELSPGPRLRYVAILIAATMAAGVTGSLWLTEPGLPLRTQIAFITMTGIGLSWMAFATWALLRRHVMLANQRVVAGRMAVAFTSLFVIGSVVAASWSSRPVAIAALITAISMLVFAIAMLRRAERILALLGRRRVELDRALQNMDE